MTDDLVTSLRALAAAQHSDLTVAADAADRIERLTRERDEARAEVERLRAALEMVRDADNDCRADGLATIPDVARRKIDEALEGKP